MLTAFDFVWGRFTERLTGITDEEYFWEPVAETWSPRPDPDGGWALDGGGAGLPVSDPAPVTTIAWRVVLHVFDEVVHHAAEVGVLRDLYQQRTTLKSATG